MKPTLKQSYAIAICEQNGFPKFRGMTRKEASDYLSKYLHESKVKSMDDREMSNYGAYDDDEDYPDLMDQKGIERK